MRFYANFPDALNEIKRDLKEMGIRIKNKSVQNLDVSDNPDYEFYEVQNYTYLVTQPDPATIPLTNPAWCEAELAERISGEGLNPGKAWLLRKEYWKVFLRGGVFDYAYPERMKFPLRRVIRALRQDINTRRAFLPIFEPLCDYPDRLDTRIPCSLGYWLVFRQGQLNITYLQRSADFSEHFRNDIWLATRLKDYIAGEIGVPSGNYCHWIGSLHVFAKDVANTF